MASISFTHKGGIELKRDIQIRLVYFQIVFIY